MPAAAARQESIAMKKRFRPYGHPRSKGVIGWRPPKEQLEFLRTFDTNMSQAHERAVDIVMDIKETLGDRAWGEVMAASYVEGETATEGEMLGRLVKEALAKRRR